MLIAVDIGNTNTVFGFFKGEELLLQARVKTDIKRTEDEFFAFLMPILSQNDLLMCNINDAVISCVVPCALASVQRFFTTYCKINSIVVNYKKHNVNVAGIIAPHLGSDLAVNAIAAAQLFKSDCLIIDFGTATTFSLLEYSKLNYIGVAIAPGRNSILQSMRNSAAQLPLLNFQKSDKILGITTIEAMHAGSYFAFIGMIEKIIDRMKEEYKPDFKVIATGGLSGSIKGAIMEIDFIEPNLTLLGLKYFYSMVVTCSN